MRQLFLALIGNRPAHGYELKRRYDELFADVWGEINIGQVYMTTNRLARDGLVSTTTEPSETGPLRKIIALTELGEKELDRWLGEPAELPAGKSDLLVRMVATELSQTQLPHQPALRAVALVAEHRQRALQALRDLDRQAAAAPRGSVTELLVQGAALHLQAELRWLDLCDLRLREPRPKLLPDTTFPFPNPKEPS